MYDLTSKVALVTGAAGRNGIGHAIALRLAQDGADVVVNDIDDNPHATGDWAGLSAVVSEIEALGRTSKAVIADISAAAQVEAMIRTTVADLGSIDILVNNAGIRAGRDRVPVVDLDEAIWDRVLRVNAKGPFLCCKFAARAMIDQGRGGRIINISSTVGKIGVARYGAYCASKFAVRGLTQVLAQELAPHRINVNAICPGLTQTERLDDMAAHLKDDDVSTEEFRQAMIEAETAKIPLGRLAQAEDIARTAAFLASAEADFLTGLSVNVSGGAGMD